MRFHVSPLALSMACLCLIGCGTSSDGPPRYRVHGTVTFNGNPVPTGMVQFIPDSEKGNKGPGGGAMIQKGYYITPIETGMVGGPMIIRISGYDGIKKVAAGEILAEGSQLFPEYETKADLAKKNIELNFEVPQPKK